MPADPVEEYLSSLHGDQRDALEALRAQLRALLPDATEVMSYRLPTFRYRDRMIVSFGATGSNCALYLLSSGLLEPFRERLQGFQTGKGNVRFAPEHPIPSDIVEALVRARMVEAGVE